MSSIVSGIALAEVGALVGDPARANMLLALAGGEALTASELAWHARVTPQTASGHLGKLAAAGLLAQERQGRHRYYRLASPRVGRMLEAIMVVAAIEGPARYRPRTRIDDALRTARTCYDHLAGRLGVALADALVAGGHLDWSEDAGVLTARGRRLLDGFGVDLDRAAQQRRAYCRPCLDWSERRPHIAGAVGAQLAQRCLALGWIERIRDTRAVAITRRGAAGFRRTFGVVLVDEDAAAA